MSFKYECLNKIGFVFNRHLGYESRDQMSTLDEKPEVKKSHASAPSLG
jgi:hypothetical protein